MEKKSRFCEDKLSASSLWAKDAYDQTDVLQLAIIQHYSTKEVTDGKMGSTWAAMIPCDFLQQVYSLQTHKIYTSPLGQYKT